MRRSVWYACAGLAMIVAAVVLAFSHVGSIVESAVERVGSEATQASVTLDGVDISTSSGEGGLHRLVIGNPRGFATASAIRLGEIKVAVDTGTIASDTIVVREVQIVAPEITYEIGSDGNNIDVIRRNVEAFAKTHGADEAAPDEGGRKLIIEHLYVRNGKVAVSASFLGGREIGAPLPDIHLTDIGKDEGGASPAEIVEKIIDSMSGGIAKAVGPLNLEEHLKGLANGVGGVADEVTKGVGGAVSKGADGVGSAIRGVFGK